VVHPARKGVVRGRRLKYNGPVPRLSAVERDVLERLRLAEQDSTTAPALASRALAILEEALAFDEAYVLAVDTDSLLFTRLLAYRGHQFDRLVHWLRDVYLVAEPALMDGAIFPNLMRWHGGLWIAHERTDRWIGDVPVPEDAAAFAAGWRETGSPPGGGLRVGFADRGRWVAALQAGRWRPGEGFERHDAELLRRVGPQLARALAERLRPARSDPEPGDASMLHRGNLLFGPNRQLAFMDEPGNLWLRRFPDDGVSAHGMAVPVAVQSLVNYLARYAVADATSHLIDKSGAGVVVRADRTSRLAEEGRLRRFVQTEPGSWVHVAIGLDERAARIASRRLTPRQRTVANALSTGSSDRAIAASLGISTNTVREHAAALHEAFGTRTRSELIAVLGGGPVLVSSKRGSGADARQ
jgi:DNA-binding CsgD family transcriptional regulator